MILKSFAGWVDEITSKTIYVRFRDDAGDYTGELPIEKFNVSVKPCIGMLFTMNVYDGGRVEFVLPPPYSQKEIDEADARAKNLSESFAKFDD